MIAEFSVVTHYITELLTNVQLLMICLVLVWWYKSNSVHCSKVQTETEWRLPRSLIYQWFTLWWQKCPFNSPFLCCLNFAYPVVFPFITLIQKRIIYHLLCLCVCTERWLAHAQAGVCSDVFLRGKLVSIRNGQTGGKNHHETGEVTQRSRRSSVSVSREYSEMNTKMKKEKNYERYRCTLHITT